MMYSMLPLPLVALAFAGGYYSNLPEQAQDRLTPDLASTDVGPARAAMARDAVEPTILEPTTEDGRHVQRSSDGLFYVHAVVNGQPVRFLVDTGASVVVLSAADARAVGAAPAAAAYSARMATAGGSRPMAWTKLGEVKVAGHAVHGVTAAVVNGGPSVSLMGQNLLSKLGAVRIEGDRMEIQPATSID